MPWIVEIDLVFIVEVRKIIVRAKVFELRYGDDQLKSNCKVFSLHDKNIDFVFVRVSEGFEFEQDGRALMDHIFILSIYSFAALQEYEVQLSFGIEE